MCKLKSILTFYKEFKNISETTNIAHEITNNIYIIICIKCTHSEKYDSKNDTCY